MREACLDCQHFSRSTKYGHILTFLILKLNKSYFRVQQYVHFVGFYLGLSFRLPVSVRNVAKTVIFLTLEHIVIYILAEGFRKQFFLAEITTILIE